MNIAVDAMGGDHAPIEIVRGAELAVAEYGCEVTLIGKEDQVVPLVQRSPQWKKTIHFVPANDDIGMDAVPTEAVRKHKEAPVVIAARMVKEGQADAMISAGNTGVTMVAALLGLGRIQGIERPAIGTVLPTENGRCLVIDVGANVDSRASHLYQFGLMGLAYAERILSIDRPRLGLLSNGEEAGKGNDLVLQAYSRFKDDLSINFVGNIEGRDITKGKADVLVCDGFTGNIVLKFAEGMSESIFGLLRQGIQESVRSRLGGLLLKPALKRIAKRMDYTEYGGAPLLGVNGVCIIAHGSSNAKAIKNAIRVAMESVEVDLPGVISEMVQTRAQKEEG